MKNNSIVDWDAHMKLIKIRNFERSFKHLKLLCRKRIDFYLDRKWHSHFRKIRILPSISIAYNSTGSIIGQNSYLPLWIFEFNFLIWEFRIMISYERKKLNSVTN